MPRRKTKEEIIEEIRNLPEGNEYELLSDYRGNKIPITLLHKTCGRKYVIRFNDFQSQHRRCLCDNRKKIYTFKDVSTLLSDKFDLISFKDMRSKIEVLCKSCNEIVDTYPRDLINGRYGCPNCSKRVRKTNDKFLYEVKKMYKSEYIFNEEYINNKTPIKCKHSVCGNSFRVSPGNFLNAKTQCPYCRVISKGENRVREVLRKLDLDFIEQYKHNKCHDKRKLPFDFYVIEEDTLIEFDGKQHFQKSFNESDSDFSLRKYHNKLKDDFAKDNNYRLLRINYKDINKIEDIIINFFN